MTTLRVLDEPRRPFFTPKSLAAYLNVSERTARQLAADGRIPSYRIEGSRRFAAEDVDRYLAQVREGGG